MIRQAHTYLAGAVSGTALIAAAVVAFVLLVSFQAMRDWPLADISLGGDDDTVTAPNAGAGAQAGPASAAGASTGAAGSTRPSNREAGDRVVSRQGTETAVGAVPVTPSDSPAAESPASGPGAPAGSSPSSTSSASSSPGGGPAASPGTNGSSSGSGTQSTSGAVTGTVNNTVSGVDDATGGVVGSTGVPKVTEEVVNGVAGPESTIGKTVDETVKVVGDLLGGNH